MNTAAATASEQTVADLAAVRQTGAALLRCLQALEHLAGDSVDTSPFARQVATVALADVRDLTEADPGPVPTTFAAPTSRDELDAPWPSTDPRPDLSEEA